MKKCFRNLWMAFCTLMIFVFFSCNKDESPNEKNKPELVINSILLDDSLFVGSTEYFPNFIKFNFGNNFLVLASNVSKLKNGVYKTTKFESNSSGTFSTDDIAQDELLVQLTYNNIIYVYFLDIHEKVNVTLKSQKLTIEIPKLILTPVMYPSGLNPKEIELKGLLYIEQYK
ncbi:MAG: hypothetical protein LC105_11030 [Chitinophagales bacterium]|nr:hypothetical protein [Chitinophagales bacterium]MCZ2394383.1 hypothetical protein [Chitinophagales bacterium]